MSKYPGLSPSTVAITGDGSLQHVALDGQDISSALTGLTMRLEVGNRPQVTLDVIALEVPTYLDEADVYIPESTRALLVKLGWTPPSDGEQPGGES